MNKEAILGTMVVRYDSEGECYVAESPLIDTIVGTGDTLEEAANEFVDFVTQQYIWYLEGRHGLYKKPGRPRAVIARVDLRSQVKPSIREEIRTYAASLGISQGEAVEFAWMKFQAQKEVAG